jgi:parallel beta-helix repeat protein
MDETKISRRALLAAAAGVLGAGVLEACDAMSATDASLPGVFNVKDYGATGNGVTDDAGAILACIAAVPKQGGVIYYPPGIYALKSSIRVDSRTDLTFAGAGASATRLLMKEDGVTILSFTGVCSRITIRDLWLGAGTSYGSGGSIGIVGTKSAYSDTFVVENVRLQNTPAPWLSQYVANSQIRNVRIMQTIPGAIKTAAVLMNSCVSDTFTEIVVLSTAGPLAGEGVCIDYDCDTIIFADSQVLRAGTIGWSCVQTAGHTGPRLCRFTNCYAETCGASGWLIEAARDVRLSGCHAAVDGGNGFEVTGGDSVTITNSLALSNKQHGILVTGGSNVLLDGNTCSNNSQQASVTYSGIRLDNYVTGVRVVNNRSGDCILTATNKQKYGVTLGSLGTDFLVVTGNDLRDNTTGALDNSSPGTNNIITGNIGVTPSGITAITVGPSPFTYLNKDGTAEALYISGGAVSSVVKNDVMLFTMSPCTVYLEPSEAVTVTYSVAPTMNKDSM